MLTWKQPGILQWQFVWEKKGEKVRELAVPEDTASQEGGSLGLENKIEVTCVSIGAVGMAEI